ncbi:MAG: iron-containing alcohol dehydrogenase [Candidatus Sericytochromatia bacterium]|nr:iron-containing alcohol dehydrogenase [Candidatus Sericytochromatia bacterium]
MPDFFQFHQPTKVIAGAGLATDFGHELAELGISRPVIVCDPIVRKLGVVDRIIAGLAETGITVGAVFSDVPPNSELAVVRQVAALFAQVGGDSLIAIGGGSTMDTAKVANILITETGDISDYVGAELLTQPLKPLICIPTTAGTGSEVTRVAVILDEATQTKISFSDRFLLPTLAVLDPELTVTMPPQVTAATGMDALTHAMEAFISPQASPFSDALAFGTMQLIQRSLLTAVYEPHNLAARADMLTAACMAGTAFTHAMVGVVHAMSHTVGGLYHVAHGVANAILLPHGLRYNLEVCTAKIGQMAHAFGVPAGETERESADRVIAHIDSLKAALHTACGLPMRLSQAGVPESGLPAVAAGAMMDGASFYNPRPMDEESILMTLQVAF